MSDSRVTFWLVLVQVLALTVSSVGLSVQRVYQHRHHDNAPHLKTDTVRDVITVPFSNGNRMTRILCNTSILTLLSAYLFIQLATALNKEDIYSIIGSAITFITWFYCFVLAVTANRFPLPDNTGWALHVHLCLLYIVLFVTATTQLTLVLWYNPAISFIQGVPLGVPVILSFDLIYTTATAKNGSPFLDENGKQVNGKQVESLLGIFYFYWMTPIIDTINERGDQLTDKDLPTLPPTHRAHNMFYIFRQTRSKKNLLYRIYLSNQYSINMQALLGVVLPVLYYTTPFFLNRLLLIIQEITSGAGDERSLALGLGYIFAMSLFIVLLNALIGQIWFFSQSSTQMRVKSMLNLEIYRKTLRRMDASVLSSVNHADKEAEDDSSKTGMIVNLMSTDSARISDFASWWFVILEAPLELIIGTYFLFTLLGWSSVLGLSCMIIMLPLNQFNSKIFVRTQDALMKARDKRVSLMNEVLQGIRQIKFFAAESNWTKRILEARTTELGYLKIIYLSEVVFMFLWQGTPLLVTTVAFWSFTKLEGRELTAPIAFTSIAIFNELRGSLTIIPETFIRLFETLISIKRIEQYLAEEEVARPDTVPSRDIKVGFVDATVSWPQSETTIPSEDDATVVNSTFMLQDLNITFPANQISLICGSTGSGKTLLMLSLLGETETKSGTVFCPRSPFFSTLDNSTATTSIQNVSDQTIPEDWILPYAVAYVSQTAWLQNASIKDNILFGLPFVAKRYQATLHACALEKDLLYLEDGDSTEIGEKGITLSGGQKARVALARAVYSRAHNVLLDDVLSAVDAHTAKHLYTKCLLGPLMQGRTQILITHHVSLCIQGSAYVVFLKEGRVQVSGSPNELKRSNQLSLIFEENNTENHAIVEEVEVTEPAVELEENKKPKALVQDETRASGRIELRLYKLYFDCVGNWFFWLFIFITVIGVRGFDIGASWWLKKWAQSYETSHAIINVMPVSLESVYQWPVKLTSKLNSLAPTATILSDTEKQDNLNMYLGIYVLFNLANIITSVTRYFTMFYGGLRASRKLYILLLDRVFHAPLRFFDTTPVGRIVNRFAKDFETIDSNVSTDIVQFCGQWVIIISIVLIATSVLPILIVLMVVVAMINVYYGLRFVAASRELKRMDSVSRSPLFTLFTETIIGVTTIRAFGMTQQFMLEMLDRIDVNARPMFYAWTVSRWVSTRIGLMGAFVSLVTGVFILFNLDRLDAATAGFCLSYILVFTEMTYWGVRRYTQLEMNFNSVERVVEFLEMDQEAPTITDIRPPTDWPSHGAIEVKDLQVKYAVDLEPVLKGISFSIKPKEKVGIVGRTGSGKSTLALAFFRFIESSQGSISIDGVNIADIGTADLRRNLTIIPQDPVLFSGTLRLNMDPFDEFSDEDIFTAFRRVHLLHETGVVNKNLFKDLTTPVSEGGHNFSQGQRQLLCLARALLKSTRVVLMDEATASVDFETDKAIQKTITQEFEECTILCIAHRLNTVIEYDRILVLDHGEVIEFESPLILLRDKDSAFYKMCRNSGEFETLVELAKAKHELVDTS
ncbi:hypothetical protein INT48_003096 [Thamnidium elegans]|uniref:P-loop containing nucleoside triphosphate hydrolase protein n=1 Tax=Thamnidium elegans TaxID=101142 RepID=A0A8H7SW69_9FUNG|nr:hypothetical protein INT48_003096 [Thamnidium elegans]